MTGNLQAIGFLFTRPLFLLTCRRAAEDRLFRLQHPEAEALVLPI